MMPARLGVPIFVVAARHERARRALRAEVLFPFVSRWAERADPGDWLIDTHGGVAMFRPSIVDGATDRPSGMVLRGRLRTPTTATAELLARRFGDDAEEVLQELRGEFALAHWNSRRRRLVVARDPLGRRSIFQRVTPDFILFCSEPAPLYKLPGEGRPETDRRSIFWFLAFGGPLPGSTLMEPVTQLRAGHFAIWSFAQGVRESRYWTPLGLDRIDPTTAAFEAGVTERLDLALSNETGDGNGYALALSGGADSSLLLALATARRRPPSFAVNVRYEAGLDANEDDYAAYAANHFKVPLKRITLTAPEALKLLEQVVGQLPEPCAAWASLSHAALLAGLREEQCDSLCSGFGADEIFGGYDHYRIAAGTVLRAADRLQAAPGRPLHAAASLDPSRRAGRLFFPGVARSFDDASLQRALNPPYDRWRHDLWQRQFYEECYRLDPAAEPIQAIVAHECRHRIPDIVLKSFEPLAARYGVQTAYPFLDPDLCRIGCALTLTDRYRTSDGKFALDRRRLLPQYKWALHRIAATRLPQQLVARKRKSYTAPFALWMRHPRFGRAILAMIADSRFWELGMVRRSTLDRALDKLEAGPGPHAHQLWCLLVLARWYDTHATL